MVNLNARSRNILRTKLNLNREVGGRLHGNQILSINENIREGPIIVQGRGTVNMPEHNKRYHTHPRIVYPIPSPENILSAFRRKSRHYSLVVTAWGIFVIENMNFNKNNNFTRNVYTANGILKQEKYNEIFEIIKQYIEYVVSIIKKSLPPNSRNKTGVLNGIVREKFEKYVIIAINDKFRKFVHISFIPW